MEWVTEMKWVGRAKGWETMKMNKNYVGNSILIVWFLFCLWAGTTIVMTYGETMHNIGFNLPAFMLIWILVIFSGRFALEWLINKLWVTS
jgi:hypothetical protein